MERSLTDAQRDEFEDMLRSLTLERSLIKEAMGFALDNADAAGEVIPISFFYFHEPTILQIQLIWLNRSASHFHLITIFAIHKV